MNKNPVTVDKLWEKEHNSNVLVLHLREESAKLCRTQNQSLLHSLHILQDGFFFFNKVMAYVQQIKIKCKLTVGSMYVMRKFVRN